MSPPATNILHQLRASRGLTQAHLAERAGVSRSYVNHLELADRQCPSVALLGRLASALDLTSEERLALYDHFATTTPLSSIAEDAA